LGDPAGPLCDRRVALARPPLAADLVLKLELAADRRVLKFGADLVLELGRR